ncbi:MAG TPA: hypothetical protein VK837_11995 [Longimicrobiales bacterium]|nr:hypothetical protein [Longimicrobiales bacterium]
MHDARKPTAALTALTLASVALAAGCQSAGSAGDDGATPATPQAAAEAGQGASAYVVDVHAEDYAFEAPDRIPSGWITFRLENAGEETHFLTVSRLPDDRTFEDYAGPVVNEFNDAWLAMRDGEIDRGAALQRLGERVPAWYWTGMVPFAGPGMVQPGGTAQATVRLEPGRYVLECYMKTAEGEFHAVEGMVRPLEVTAEDSGAPEPDADLRLTIGLDGYTMSGTPRSGTNRVAVAFAEQPEAGFGNDVHVARLDAGDDPASIAAWMDAYTIGGLSNPAPAEFVGGTHQQPAGHTVYFTVDLTPGRYALISEAAIETPMYEVVEVR